MTDTLAGALGAKQEWTEHGMIAAVDPSLSRFRGLVRILAGERDLVERPESLRAAFASVLPAAAFEIIPASGHLSPIEAPAEIAAACAALVAEVDRREGMAERSASAATGLPRRAASIQL